MSGLVAVLMRDDNGIFLFFLFLELGKDGENKRLRERENVNKLYIRGGARERKLVI